MRRHRLVLPALVTLGVMAGFLAGLHLGYTALAGAVVLMIATRRDPRDAFALVDWPLLVFFASLFVVMGALGKTGLAQETFDAAAPHMDLRTASGAAVFSGVFTFGSNVFSNVPVVLLGGPHVAQLGTGALGFALLGYVTTVAGNLTLIGSVANLIVAESARDVYKLGFVEYLRFGAVSTLVSLVVGAPIVCALA